MPAAHPPAAPPATRKRTPGLLGDVDEWRRPGPTGTQLRNDLWIGLAVVALAIMNLFLSRSFGMLASENSPARIEQIAWAVGTTLPIACRRRWPEAAAIVMSLLYIGGQVRGAQEQQVASYTLYAMIYTLGAWGTSRLRARNIRLGIIVVMFGWLTVAFFLSHDLIMDDGFSDASGELPALWALVFNTYFLNAVFFGSVYLIGDAAWNSARRLAKVESQAAELGAAHGAAAERAVIGERVRIARELHDVVAHHVSVMGIQASACRRALDKDPARARAALTAIEDGARTAVDELRRMLGALRASGATADAAPAGVDRITELAENAREAGLTVDYAVYGDPVPLPDSVSQAAYRIVQEAATNTLKHANARSLDIRLRYLTGELEVDVADDGRGTVRATADGMGLIGMRERVSIHDGTLEHGPRGTGGYRVRARLPYARALASAGGTS